MDGEDDASCSTSSALRMGQCGWDTWLASSLSQLRASNLMRALHPTEPFQSSSTALISPGELAAWAGDSASAAVAYRPPQPLLLFSLNDYLGLASHPAVRREAAQAVQQYGMGPRSSALVGGYTTMHRELELGLADLKHTEDCLLFPTGFAANLAVMSVLGGGSGGDDVAIFSDELNHASIIDGARLASRSGAGLHVYRHNDLSHLDQLLSACPPRQRKLVVTDSLFSMDGDFADLQGLAALKRRHGFLLAVDEAHSTLVCGDRGGGAAEALGVEDQVDLHIGTLSKAFGALGGFVATSRSFKSLFVNRARPLIYSTALPLPVVAAAQAALAVSHRECWRRKHVWQLVARLGDALGVAALSPVVPLVLGGEALTLEASTALLRKGLHVPAIRPPTVAPGTCRLRVSLSSAHSCADVDALVAALQSGTCGSLIRAGLQRLPHLDTPGAQTVRRLQLEPRGLWAHGHDAEAPAASSVPDFLEQFLIADPTSSSSSGGGSSSSSSRRRAAAIAIASKL